MAFRGIFDGSVEIGQAREQRAQQAAMQQQQIQAQMAMQRAQLQASAAAQANQLAASTAQADKEFALKQQQLQANTDMGNRELAMKQQQFQAGMDLDTRKLDMAQSQFDSGETLRQQQQQMAALSLQQAQASFDEDQARRAALTAFRRNTFGAGIVSAMLNGVMPTEVASGINKANGVPDGEPGAVIGGGGGPDGVWYDMMAVGQDNKPGKIRQEIDPMKLLAMASSIFDEKTLGYVVSMYLEQNRGNTRMTIAMEKMKEELENAQLKAAGDVKVDKFDNNRFKALQAMQEIEAAKVGEPQKTFWGNPIPLTGDALAAAEKVKGYEAQMEAELAKGAPKAADEPPAATMSAEETKAAPAYTGATVKITSSDGATKEIPAGLFEQMKKSGKWAEWQKNYGAAVVGDNGSGAKPASVDKAATGQDVTMIGTKGEIQKVSASEFAKMRSSGTWDKLKKRGVRVVDDVTVEAMKKDGLWEGYVNGTMSPSEAKLEPEPVVPAEKGNIRAYTVKEGDDVYSVAIRFGVSASGLREANGIKQKQALTVGQVVNIPNE